MKKRSKNIKTTASKEIKKKSGTPKSAKKINASKKPSKQFLAKLEKEIIRKEEYHKKLIENEEKYRILSQITSDYMFSASFEKNKTISLDWYSNRFEEEIGYPIENLFNFRHIRRYIFQDDLPLVIPIRNKLLKGENVEREIRLFNSDGEIIWVLAKLFPVYDKRKKRVTKFYCAAQNITRRKKAEIELKELNQELELRIQERTSQLENAVKNLQHEIEIRTETEKKLNESQKQLLEFAEGLDKKLRESEYKHLWNVFEQSEIPTLTVNEDGNILDFNNSFEKLTGYKKEELKTINQFAEKLFAEENRARFFELLHISKDDKIHRECSIITKNDLRKEILGLISNLLHEGKETGIKIIQFLDITESKRITQVINSIAQDVSSKSGQKFFDSLVEAIAKSIDADYTFIGTHDAKNPEIVKTLSVFGEGKPLDNFSYLLEGTPCENVFEKEIVIFNQNCWAQFPKDTMLKDLEIEAYAGVSLFDSFGKLVGILVALKKFPFDNVEFVSKVLSIYSTRAADELEITNIIDSLKASEEKFSKAFHTSPDSININRLHDGLYLDVNNGFCNLTGLTKEEVIGKTSAEINIWYDLNDRLKLVQQLKEKGTVSNFNSLFRMKDGTVINGLMSASIIELKGEKCIISITRDISDIIKKEEELKQSEERYKILMEASPYAHFVHIDGVVIYANEATVKMFKANSIDDVIGKNLYDYMHPDYFAFAKKRIEQIKNGANNLPSAEIKFICLDGSIIDAEVSARAFNYNNQQSILVVANDITEKKIAQRKLIESETRYKKLFDLSPEAFYLVDNDRFILVNGAFLNLVGAKSFDEIKDKSLLDFVHPDYKTLYLERKKTVLQSTELEAIPFVEYKLIKLDGSIVYAEISSSKIEFEGRTVVQSVARNITERKSIESALKESQERYKLIAENSPYALAVHQNGKLIYANPATLKMMNAKALDEIIGKPVLDFVHPDYKQIAIKRIQEGAKTLQMLPPQEEKLLSLDGKEFIAEITSIPFYLNGILSFQLIINDVTKIKAANEQLTVLSNALEQSSSGILISDVEGKIEYVNKKFEEITGYELKDIVGQTPRILKSGKQDLAFYQNLWNTILSGNNYRAELLNKKKNGELYWELNSISSIKNAEGKITHFVAVKEDITEQKKIEFELRKAKDEAEEAAKVRTHLLANMSHEFRTPLGSIIGYSSILKDEAENDETKRMAKQIEASANRLMKTFNELITLTELETDEFAINPVEVDLPFFCSQIRVLYETMALSKGLEIKTQLATEELTTFIDESILTKIVGYIFDNAIKFTEKGEITIELENPFTKNDKQFAVISIQDTGKGIKEDELEIIFKEFRQISEGIRRDFEGLGLGLTLASRLARLIDVEISVISEFEKGSKFSLTIPIKTEQQISEEVAQKITKRTFDATLPTKENIDILVVEDNPLNIDILQKVLAKSGKIVTARDGKTAVKIAEGKKFDIMLIDINLGYGIDGIEVLNQIRNFDHHKNTPAIALTAYASEMSKREFLQKGFSDFISKPFEKKALIDLVENLGRKSS